MTIPTETTQARRPSFESMSATDLVEGLERKLWTSVDLTTHYIERIHAHNPNVRAVVSDWSSSALEQARTSDKRRAEGRALSRIDGLPMTLKDAFRVRDRVTTYGMLLFKYQKSHTDSAAIEALRFAGVVFLGQTAVPTASFDWNCRNQVYPECVNPFDPTRTPGGSSGGAAAALASGMTPVELGSDIGGSIRYPAHCCGVYGLRTTDGWIPIEDMGPEGHPPGLKHIASCGPLARHAGDLDLLLEIFEERFPKPRFEPRSSDKLRIAYSAVIDGLEPDQATRRAFDNYLSRWRKAGHDVVETEPPFDCADSFRDWGLIAGYEIGSGFPRWARNWLMKNAYAWVVLKHRLGGGPFTQHFRAGLLSGKSEYRAAMSRRSELLKKTEAFFSGFDLWMLPVSPAAAIDLKSCGRPINGVPYTNYLGTYLVPTALMGTPALACPIGADEDGMPIGVQIHGPRFSDRWLVRTAGGSEK